jgi:hypothetical protein
MDDNPPAYLRRGRSSHADSLRYYYSTLLRLRERLRRSTSAGRGGSFERKEAWFSQTAWKSGVETRAEKTC